MPAKSKFRQTKALVRLAINEGWTQAQIANACRTQQSVVSAWKNGEKLATEAQVMPLLEVFGDKLRRNSFRVYYSLDGERYKFYKVEGNIIFSHVLFDPDSVQDKPKLRAEKFLKFVIHNQGKGKFILVKMHRPRFNENGKVGEYLTCNKEDGIWFSEIGERMSAKKTVAEIDRICSNAEAKISKHDQVSLPYLIRQSFVQNGFPLEEIEEFPAQW